MKRGILIGIAAVAVAIVVGVYVLYSSLGGIIQAAVEKVGSEATQTSVRLDGVDLDIGSGKGALNGFTVGNPKGFETPSAFKLGAVSLQVDAATVTGNPVLIKEIVIDKPEITYELGAAGSNIDAIKRNVDAYAGKFAGKFAGKKPEAKAEGDGTKVVIEHLYVRGGRVNVSSALLKGKAMGATLPDIHLTDIGKDKGGASPAEVAKKVIDSMTAQIGGAMSSIGIGKTLDSLQKTLGGAAGKAVGELGKTGGAAGDAAKDAAKDAVGKAGDSMKKLFGN